MATNKVNLGIGNASGMAFHAPANTAAPAYPGASLAGTDWEEIGAISEDGISYGLNYSKDAIRNWALEIERLKNSDGDATIQAPFIDTTEEVFNTLFGEDNVTVTAATTSHGKLISVEIGPDTQTEGEAFLFLMKDGDDMISVYTPKGFITSVDDIDFAPDDAITWNATISSKSWTVTKDDGQVTSL